MVYKIVAVTAYTRKNIPETDSGTESKATAAAAKPSIAVAQIISNSSAAYLKVHNLFQLV